MRDSSRCLLAFACLIPVVVLGNTVETPPQARVLAVPATRLTFRGGANANPAWSSDGRWIAFDSDTGPEQRRAIHVMRADGTDLRVLPGSRRDQAPRWSPDGTEIAFETFRDGNAEVYLMRADGSESRRLTANPHYDGLGDWSAAGLIWFAGRREDTGDDDYGAADLWRLDSRGATPQRITTADASDTYPTASPDGRYVAFTSHRDGNAELYVRELASGHERRLTRHPASDDHARWSPRGDWIAFVSWRDGREQIYLADPSGETVVQLDFGVPQARDIAWSPDGKAMVFSARGADGSDLYRAELPEVRVERPVPSEPLTAGLQALTSAGTNEIEPSWSPDGKFIAFVTEVGPSAHWGEHAIHFLEVGRGLIGRMRRSLGDGQPHWHPDDARLVFRTAERDGTTRLYVARSDGRLTVNLTKEEGIFAAPAWSPDGTRLVFTQRRTGPPAGADVYLVDARGGAKRRLTDGARDYRNPAWTPDGTALIVSAEVDGNRDLHRLSLADGALRRLTEHPGTDDFPRVSPDGGSVAFVSQRDGNAEIYTMRIDGTQQRNLSNDPAVDGWPAWSPDGTKIAFASKRRGTFDLFLVHWNP